MVEEEGTSDGIEWHKIGSKETYFDGFDRRYFINATDRSIAIGFGHNARRAELIVINNVEEGPENEDPALEALKGVVVKED